MRIEPSRRRDVYQNKTFTCYHLADELRKRGWNRIDYMTIDTEGSELEIVLDFPWNDFDIRVVQVEQLVETKYPSQMGRKDAIIQHLQKFGYKLLSVYQVEEGDTDDLILTRNVDEFLAQAPAHPRDGDHYQRRDNHRPQKQLQQSKTMLDYVARMAQQERQQLDELLEMPLDTADPQAILQRRKFLANEALKARKAE